MKMRGPPRNRQRTPFMAEAKAMREEANTTMTEATAIRAEARTERAAGAAAMAEANAMREEVKIKVAAVEAMVQNAGLRSDDLKAAFALHGSRVCARKVGFYDKAEELLQRALEIFEARLGRDDLCVAYTLCEMGHSVSYSRHHCTIRYEQVEALYERPLGIFEAKLERNDLNIATALLSLSFPAWSMGRNIEEDACSRRYVAIVDANERAGLR